MSCKEQFISTIKLSVNDAQVVIDVVKRTDGMWRARDIERVYLCCMGVRMEEHCPFKMTGKGET